MRPGKGGVGRGASETQPEKESVRLCRREMIMHLSERKSLNFSSFLRMPTVSDCRSDLLTPEDPVPVPVGYSVRWKKGRAIIGIYES